jgi:protein-tyrosine-phosphatase
VIPISEEVKEYLAREDAAAYLKKAPEDLSSKRISDFDLIVAMEQRHKDALVARCPECESRIAVWNIEDPYLLPAEQAERIYEQIREKAAELARTL